YSVRIYYAYLDYLVSQPTAYGSIGRYFFRSGIEQSLTSLSATLLFALILGLLFLLLRRFTGGLLIDGKDTALLFLGMLAAGWPNMLIFLTFVFLLVILFNFTLSLIGKKRLKDRITITPAIPLAVLLTIYFGQYVADIVGLSVIRF
ncbi:MAG: hypothetical protein V1838_00470, partial [Patescibacteria group bacterium]